jgi:hypothetical protein
LNYKKIIVYLVIVIVAISLWLKSEMEESQRQEKVELFASVYAGTTVTAELYRNDPERFFIARDSIFAHHGVDSSWVSAFRQEFEGNEEIWTAAWDMIRIKVDSLVESFKNKSKAVDSPDTLPSFLESTPE